VYLGAHQRSPAGKEARGKKIPSEKGLVGRPPGHPMA